MSVFYETHLGKIVHSDSLIYLNEHIADESVDLIVTSPPFGLVRKKDYGNVDLPEAVSRVKSPRN